MKIKVLITAVDSNFGEIVREVVEVSSNALAGRPPEEIIAIVDMYIKDWIYDKLGVNWVFVEQSSFGLEFKPSESGDD